MTSDKLGQGLAQENGQTELSRAAEFIRTSVAIGSDKNPLAHIHFSDRLAQYTARRGRNQKLAAAGAACMMAFGAVYVSVALQPKVLTYRVDNAAELGTLGSYMSAPAQASLGLQFSEGSRVVLQPRAKGRVSQTSRHGATMVLEDGHAHAEIVHRDDTDWRVLAGPFVVGVTGTSFDVAFDLATQTFELKMQSGKVRVTGPGLKDPVEVQGNQRLVLSAKGTEQQQPRAEVATAAASATAAAPEQADPEAAASRSETTPATAASQRRSAATPDVESFGQLGARGQHQRIVELAERQGFDSAIDSSNCTDLLALGNAARFAGRANLAAMAYRGVRERFAHSAEATTAAFFLGRLSETGSPKQAISWYERYVAEAPSGVWVADALGRRMAILNESQAGPAAQTAAKEYLERFPSGPYAGFARKILKP
jgi:ferric-dicitrate binding protein FerR (iron transport regulator)